MSISLALFPSLYSRHLPELPPSLKVALEDTAIAIGEEAAAGRLQTEGSFNWISSGKIGDEIIPTHGNFAGPGYGAGNRNPHTVEELELFPVSQVTDPVTGKKRPDEVDVIAKAHDIAYTSVTACGQHTDLFRIAYDVPPTMEKLARMTHLIVLISLLLSYVVLNTACVKTYPGARQLAIDMAIELKSIICSESIKLGKACKNRDVREEADFGNAVYVYVYGVSNQKEIQQLTEVATKFRDKRDSRIPVYLTFYHDLTKSHKIKTVELKGEQHANY